MRLTGLAISALDALRIRRSIYDDQDVYDHILSDLEAEFPSESRDAHRSQSINRDLVEY